MSDKKNKKDINRNKIKEIEDTTKYGEFVSSYFGWKTLQEQKDIANKLENITKDENKTN